ncbi:hypothetical protein FRC00_001506 [Tulasnella sp. 408]|nr:hypothetical protein FRC00_001506 [Tulasnella sp. 408]
MYFSRKMGYDLNVQVVHTFTNLQIVDYFTGFTSSAHDSNAFQYSAVVQHPGWFFGSDQEFMWGSSAYTVTSRVIPVHKRPVADDPLNRQFDTAVLHICIRSEHCMGAIKGRFQSLHGLWIRINCKRDHVDTCNWIQMCLILHNLVIDIEGEDWAAYYRSQLPCEEYTNTNPATDQTSSSGVTVSGEARHRQLVAKYTWYREERQRSQVE